MFGGQRYIEGGVLWLDNNNVEIFTVNNLIRRHIIIVDWCCICKNSEETVDHLLLHCDGAKELWSFALMLFGKHWVMSKTVVECLWSWRGLLGKHKNGVF